jgi:chaperonin GroES
MKFVPLFDKVLLKRDDAKEETTINGIILPSSAVPKPNEGLVVAVGPGKLNHEGLLMPMYVDVGDKVMFGEYSGLEVKLPEGTFLLVSQDELLGVFKEKVSDDDVPF